MRSTNQTNARVLIIEADRGIASLYADVIGTHCDSVRIDVCSPADDAVLHDNVGGADVIVCSCGAGGGNRFDVMRDVLTQRSCATVLVLVPADMPELADEAIACGASDVLVRAPGYLEQLAVSVRKNVAKSRVAMRAELRAEDMRREMVQMRREAMLLRTELEEVSRRAFAPKERVSGVLPLPVITRPVEMAKAA